MNRLLLGVLMAACSSAGMQDTTADVNLSVEAVPALPGDSVTLVLENASETEVGYNLCPSTLVRQSSDEWIAVPSDRICTMELRMLQPGQSDRFTLTLPEDIAPGTYRFETMVERTDAGPRGPLLSAPFEVHAR